jgi:hypothetical protein
MSGDEFHRVEASSHRLLNVDQSPRLIVGQPVDAVKQCIPSGQGDASPAPAAFP